MNPHRAKFMRPAAQAAAAGLKTRPCANCGEPSGNAFCQRCYSLVDGHTKRSMRNLFTLGSPKLALRRVLDKLDELRAGGVPVPERKHGPRDLGEGRPA